MNPIHQQKKLLLNCDMGESMGAWSMGMDEQVMPLIDMANIACGFHASDPVTMSRTVALAKRHNVYIGAHPSYPDLVGFGRRSMQCSPLEISTLIQYQIGALAGICSAHGARVSYVKPHGALYNDMMKNTDILRAVLQGVSGYAPGLPLMLLAMGNNDVVTELAQQCGVPLLLEAFADRAYSSDGSLLPRQQPGAVYEHEAEVLMQVRKLLTQQVVSTPCGATLPLQADSLCVHGDNAASIRALQSIRVAVDQHYHGCANE